MTFVTELKAAYRIHRLTKDILWMKDHEDELHPVVWKQLDRYATVLRHIYKRNLMRELYNGTSR